MTLDETMAKLESMGHEKWRKHNAKAGCDDNQFGVAMGDIRALAKALKTNHELGLALYRTGNADAMILASFIMKPKLFSIDELDDMVGRNTFTKMADHFNTYIVKLHPEKEALRLKWMQATDPMRQRAAWSLTTERVVKTPDGLDLDALLDRIEVEMKDADPSAQWTMNYCLAEIGINFPDHRQRAIAIGEKLEVLKDYPVSKGCTSPFAPIWIDYFVSRQG